MLRNQAQEGPLCNMHSRAPQLRKNMQFPAGNSLLACASAPVLKIRSQLSQNLGTNGRMVQIIKESKTYAEVSTFLQNNPLIWQRVLTSVIKLIVSLLYLTCCRPMTSKTVMISHLRLLSTRNWLVWILKTQYLRKKSHY